MSDENPGEGIDRRGAEEGTGEVRPRPGRGAEDTGYGDHDPPEDREAGEAQVGAATEEEVKRCEYALGVVYECAHCSKVAVMSDINLFQAAMQNATLKGDCPNCKKPIILEAQRPVIMVPQPVPMNRHQRRAAGLVGLNGKRMG